MGEWGGNKNPMEGHSSRLEQLETEFQNLKIKWKLKEKPIFSRPVKQYARTH
jgi:hypothetical protein